MLLAIPFPAFDPVIFTIGPFSLHWYAVAYILGLVMGCALLRRTIALAPAVGTKEQADDFLTWATLGVVLGGRLGYVLFYRPDYYFEVPYRILEVWKGGMSFHGGILGVIVAVFLFARRNNMSFLALGDRIAPCAPLGLFFGRIANFVNSELWGRTTDVPWAVIFPTGGPEPRHPSQLYQALLEGLILFIVLFALSRRESIRARIGLLSGVFLMGYGIARIIGEFFRQPDDFLGFLSFGVTMGQVLSIPMVLIGLLLVLRARKA